MGTIYANNGDTIVVQHHGVAREFRVEISGDEKSGEISFEHINPMCKVCGEMGGVEYETSTGVKLCAGCVNRALVFMVVRDIMYRIDRYDDDLNTALDILADDDKHMSESGTSYVDSLSAGWDMIRGCSRNDLLEYMEQFTEMIYGATRTIPA